MYYEWMWYYSHPFTQTRFDWIICLVINLVTLLLKFPSFYNAKENWIGLWRSSMIFLSFWCALVNSLSVTFGKTKKGEQLGYLCLEGNGLCEVLCCKLVVVYNFFSLYWVGLRVVNEKFGKIHLVLTMGFSYLV